MFLNSTIIPRRMSMLKRTALFAILTVLVIGFFSCSSLPKSSHPDTDGWKLANGISLWQVILPSRENVNIHIHDDTSLFIEFPRGPLGVGDAPVNDIATLEEETGILKLLTPTDCIKDRWAAYYHWDDPQSLEQAVWVAEQNDFDLKSVETWSVNENELEKFKIFKSRV